MGMIISRQGITPINGGMEETLPMITMPIKQVAAFMIRVVGASGTIARTSFHKPYITVA